MGKQRGGYLNNKRRKKLKQAISLLDSVYEIIFQVAEEEQDCFDNLPENLQESDRGEKMEEAISELENAAEKIDEGKESIENAMF